MSALTKCYSFSFTLGYVHAVKAYSLLVLNKVYINKREAIDDHAVILRKTHQYFVELCLCNFLSHIISSFYGP